MSSDKWHQNFNALETIENVIQIDKGVRSSTVERELVRETHSREFTMKNTTIFFFFFTKKLLFIFRKLLLLIFFSENKVHSPLAKQQSSFVAFSFAFLSFEWYLLPQFFLRLTFKLQDKDNRHVMLIYTFMRFKLGEGYKR